MKRPAFILLAVLVLACRGITTSEAKGLAIQAAAIEFLGRLSSGAVCVRVATEPGEMVEGLVTNHLQDPPPSLLEQLRRKGVRVQPYSACDLRAEPILLSVGWPSQVSDGAEVAADWICGPACGNGYVVHVQRTGSEWRGVGARGTWIS